ncbi:MAG: HTTM domain-containing protein [Proteobacteria bacterium]|nr:HTTM domain-containing protein [Pseudomonadota bacterium]MCP4919327.1 HTTM domain-containing protein [Pseudomonadota bacterium]
MSWLRAREGGQALAVMRVLVALCLLVDVWHIGSIHVDAFSSDGFASITTSVLQVRMLLGGLFVAAVALGLGLGGRITAFVALQLALQLYDVHGALGGGHDRLTTNALWLLVLGGSTYTWSLDAQLLGERQAPVWARYLVVFQLVVVYFTTGLQKVSPEWWPWGGYDAVWYLLQAPSWSKLAEVPLWLHRPSQLASLGTMVFELAAPLFLISVVKGRRWHWPLIVVGAGMHLGIAATMDVGTFSWISLALYPCLLRPELFARFRRRGGGGS